MIRDSLRLRLLAGAAVAIFVALALAGAAMGWFFENHIEQREAAALIRHGKLIAGNLRVDAAGKPVLDTEPGDDRYQEAASGLYWQLSNVRGSAHSHSLWDQSLPALADQDRDGWRLRHAPGPFGKTLLIVGRPIQVSHGDEPVLVQVATDDAPLRIARADFNTEIIFSLGILWLFLVTATYVQVGLGLRPLRVVRNQLAALRRNSAARLPATHPREIAPLAEAINALADAREVDLARSRTRAGDLAHSLKTPLAAMSAQSRRAREAGAVEAADGLDQAIVSMRATLETELARARAAAARDAGQSRAADIETLIENIITVVERTEHGERVLFEVSLGEDLDIPVAADDLIELLGALIENASRHARTRVRVTGQMEESAATIRIDDDGPGLGNTSAEAVLARGARLDEAGPGHGLGLAIVNDLMQATDGTILLAASPLGGLQAQLTWPVDPIAPSAHKNWITRWLTRN